ncbi:MAG: V-type ATP synthase subunit I, partial [Butyricimonas faecihominis]
TALREESVNIGKELDAVSQDAIERLKKYRLKITEVADKIKVEDAAQHLIDEKVIALEGWIPVEREAEMRSFLETKDVYFEFTRPTPEDDVPVQLKNNAYSKLFEPVTEMFALPQYRELDLTPFLAPFFMLFFGMCMGDGGYGLIIWLACFIIGRKASPSVKGYLVLGQYLGIMTVIVGLLTGSFFGIALDSVEWPWLAGVKSLFLTEANYGKYLGGYNPMMIIAVAVGIIQILYGMCLNAARLTKQFGFKYAVSTLGWVVAIILLGVLIGLPMLKVVIRRFEIRALRSVRAFALTIYFYNSPEKGFSLISGPDCGERTTWLGLLGDTLSYIRLFAIGLTGSILGGVFNTLAFQLTDGLPFIVKFIAVFLILLVGHSINFGLCMISSFVHPMRLTFVEFYKNAGFEGGGKQYAPFRKKVND